jgi:hypothetical protein
MELDHDHVQLPSLVLLGFGPSGSAAKVLQNGAFPVVTPP